MSQKEKKTRFYSKLNSLTESVLRVNEKKIDTVKVGLSLASCGLTLSSIPFLNMGEFMWEEELSMDTTSSPKKKF